MCKHIVNVLYVNNAAVDMVQCHSGLDHPEALVGGGGGGTEASQTTAAVQTLRRLFEEWDARLEMLQPTAK